MMPVIPSSDYYRLEYIATYFDEAPQVRKLVEEMGELIRACMRWLNREVRPDQVNVDNFAEECADVLLMLQQVITLMKFRTTVKRIYEKKLNKVFNLVAQIENGEFDDVL
jgi:NTP pyrophosphatase (non-canonical NTP hydrolase)